MNAADAAFFVAMPLCGAPPLRPGRGKLIPAPKLQRCRTRKPLFNILLTAIAYMARPVPIRLHGSLRAALPKYFISACSKARFFRLRFYALYVVIISAVLVVWFFVGALFKRPWR